MQLTAIPTQALRNPPQLARPPLYPVRQTWLVEDALIEAELLAEAWQETACVYEATCYDGERCWLVYDVTTATGIAQMRIDAGRIVASRAPECEQQAGWREPWQELLAGYEELTQRLDGAS